MTSNAKMKRIDCDVCLRADEGAIMRVCSIVHHNIRSSLTYSINVDMCASSIMWVKGDNGVGKSTFLKILADLKCADSGHVLCDDDISYLGSAIGIKSYVTVGHYLKLMSGDDASCYDKGFDHTYDCLHDIAMDTPVYQLSSGQQIALRLYGITCQKNRVWILDEPFRFLDENGIAHFSDDLILHLENDGIAVIATHPVANVHLEYQLNEFNQIALTLL